MHSIEEVLFSGQTKYQSVEILRCGSYGRCLVLDGKIQSSESDEFIYHEALVQPVMVTHPDPKTVFIAGGGEGATLREVLSHQLVKRAVMVDIDTEVIDICKRYLSDFNQGSFHDKRTELYHVDARQYLLNCDTTFDIIIIDLPDPLEEGPAYLLYTQEFFRMAQTKLNSGGMVAVQAGSASWAELLNLSAVTNTLKSVFPVVFVYKIDVPCFGGPWGFCIASQKLNPMKLSPNDVDGVIVARSLEHLKFYDGITHQGMFSLPKNIRQEIENQKRLITDHEPLYLYKG
jgi:spermidine synthase